MMFILAAAVLVIGTLAFVFLIRRQDLPDIAPAAPWAHLDIRRAQIYENLRDLQFEYRVGKLSDTDYQETKLGLQAELAGVLAEIDLLKTSTAPAAPATPKAAGTSKNGARAAVAPNTCPHCSAKFDRALKFCGECGKPMAVKA